MKNIKIRLADISPLENKELFNEAMVKIPPYRRQKVLSFRFEKDRLLSLGASLLLCASMEENGLEPGLIPEYGEHGKPYFENTDFHFSLSHSGTKAMCAFSDRPLGCDIEEATKADLKIASRYFTEEERNYIFGFEDEEQKNREFFRVWVLKESFIKSTGAGLSMSLNAFSVVENKKIRTEISHGNKEYLLFSYDCIGGYACACCAEKSEDIQKYIPENNIIDDIGKLIKSLPYKE